MNIWFINHYSVPSEYYYLTRTYNFAKYLSRQGHKITIFAASTAHNSPLNLVSKNDKYRVIEREFATYVLIHCKDYNNNGIKRILNMIEFAFKLPKYTKLFNKPDVIIGTSLTLQACKKSIQIAKKYKCKSIAEVADLWPESLVAYGYVKNHNPVVWLLRKTEKWIYKNADQVVFTMEGAYDYIKKMKWDKVLPLSKINFINNGVDLEDFKSNMGKYILEDKDLLDEKSFKIIYVGSIRRANNVGRILDAAKLIRDKNIKILIYGSGDEETMIHQRIIDEEINNVFFKGFVDKKYIPYVLSHSDATLFIVSDSPILEYGVSPNKLFDYFAAGKPIIISPSSKYNPALLYGAGISTENLSPCELARVMTHVYSCDKRHYIEMCNNAKRASNDYSFKNLSNHLMAVINKI